MDEIVKRLMEVHKLDEMAMTREDAINRCGDLGRKFIEHFHKVYTEGLEDKAFNHHCQEMQVWYTDASQIVLKHNKRLISNNNLIDWFFTKGSSTEYLFNDEKEEVIYNELMVRLLADKSKKVVDVMTELLSD